MEGVIDLTGDSQQAAPPAPPRRARKRKAPAAAATVPASPPTTSAAAAPPTPSPAKRTRKQPQAKQPKQPQAKQPKEPKQPKVKQEKRTDASGNTVRFLAQPSQATRERMARALPGSGHRMFLMDRKTLAPIGSPDGPVEEFVVLGATANVYKVTVGRHLSCNCPDARKGNVCKHQLFVMLRVLRLRQDDPLVWQRALLPSEAEQVLGGARGTRTEEAVLAAPALRQQYRRLSGEAPAAEEAAASVQKPVEGDCPICYDDLCSGGSAAADRIVFCAVCGNNVHAECFKNWAQQKRRQGDKVTCVYCRSEWQDPTSGAAAGPSSGGYINLAVHSAAHRGADTSLEALYGDRSVWIRANSGSMGRAQAARLWALTR